MRALNQQPWDDEPDEWQDQSKDECEHEHADYDLIEGSMRCSCDYHRFLSGDEIRREAEFQAVLMEAYYRLFPALPDDPAPLPSKAAAMLAGMPTWPDTQEVTDEGACRWLERRGLVKVERCKSDPIAHRPTMYAGRLP